MSYLIMDILCLGSNWAFSLITITKQIGLCFYRAPSHMSQGKENIFWKSRKRVDTTFASETFYRATKQHTHLTKQHSSIVIFIR